jgi:hypothetical protein
MPVPSYRINIDQVEASLRAVQQDFKLINQTLDMRREHLADEIVENMIAGYQYVNQVMEMDISLLALNGLHYYLELNHIVLCGRGTRNRKNYCRHIQRTNKQFHEQKAFSISHLRSWSDANTKVSPWKRAAGVYILQISRPQLFPEGNHRTGALLMSSMLVRNGKPPFVLSVNNAKAYFDPSSLAKSTLKNIWGKHYKLPKIRKKFAKFLKSEANPKLLENVYGSKTHLYPKS